MAEQLNMAIAGVGRIGITHAAAMAQVENVKFMAVVDPNESLGREVAAKFGCDYYRSIPELAARPDIAAVNICVPEEHHLSAAKEAAAAGKHILIEKPLAKTFAESMEIIDLAKAHGVRLMVAQTCRYVRQYRKLRNEMQAGRIGELCQVCIRRFAPRGSMEYVKGRVSILYYIGIHDLDAIQWVTGHKITSVFARKLDKTDAYGEDGYSMLFTFDNGACGTMDLGWYFPAAYPGGLTKIDIVGSEGVLFFDMMQEGISFYKEREQPVSPSFGYVDGRMVGAFVDMISGFSRCILDKEDFPEDTLDIAESIKVVEAVLRSADSGLNEIV